MNIVSSVLLEEENLVVFCNNDDQVSTIVVNIHTVAVIVVEPLHVILEKVFLVYSGSYIFADWCEVVAEAVDSQVEIEEVDDVIEDVKVRERQAGSESISTEDGWKGRATDYSILKFIDSDVSLKGRGVWFTAIEERSCDEVVDSVVFLVLVEHDFTGVYSSLHKELKSLVPLYVVVACDVDHVEVIVVLGRENFNTFLDTVHYKLLGIYEFKIEALDFLAETDFVFFQEFRE